MLVPFPQPPVVDFALRPHLIRGQLSIFLVLVFSALPPPSPSERVALYRFRLRFEPLLQQVATLCVELNQPRQIAPPGSTADNCLLESRRAHAVVHRPERRHLRFADFSYEKRPSRNQNFGLSLALILKILAADLPIQGMRCLQHFWLFLSYLPLTRPGGFQTQRLCLFQDSCHRYFDSSWNSNYVQIYFGSRLGVLARPISFTSDFKPSPIFALGLGVFGVPGLLCKKLNFQEEA